MGSALPRTAWARKSPSALIPTKNAGTRTAADTSSDRNSLRSRSGFRGQLQSCPRFVLATKFRADSLRPPINREINRDFLHSSKKSAIFAQISQILVLEQALTG